jgi:hypothetical protein
VSGQRGLSLTMNDPASTAAQTSAKAGDDVLVTLGGLREIQLILPGNARLQRRQRTTRVHARKPGTNQPIKDDDGNYVYEEQQSEETVLVLSGSATLFGRASNRDKDAETIEAMPHTTIYAKRWGEELHYIESGSLLEEVELAELVRW